MSIASRFESRSLPADVPTLRPDPGRAVGTAAFWLAVLFPLFYAGLMVGGLEAAEFPLLVAGFGLNAVALVLGRDRYRETA